MLVLSLLIMTVLLFVLLVKMYVDQKEIKELVYYYRKLFETCDLNDVKINGRLLELNNSIIKTNNHIVNLINILQESNNKSSDKDKFINYVITSIGDILKDTSAISKNLYFVKGNISVLCDKLRIKRLGKDRYFGKESIPPVKLNLVKGSDNDIDDDADYIIDNADESKY